MKRWTAAAAAALVLMGCSGNALKFRETPEGSQSVANLDEAGSVHVSVLAVTPWDEIKAKLRPNLAVDPKTLREQAIPTTYTLLDKYLDILRLQVALAPTTVKATSTTTSTSETGADDHTTTTETITKAPGTPRAAASVPSLAAGAAPAASAPAVTGINSSLTARAMASFAQEIQALNAEVDNAAQRTGFDPYLMRIQVSVMPRRRNLGYDVYPNLSFFSYAGAFDPETGAPQQRTATMGTPFVVPLLSSDSIEAAQRSQSNEALRDVGFALDLLKGFGAAGLGVNSQKDRQQAQEGRDINSLQMLGRLSDNTIRVRLGAALDSSGGYVVHPRTNTISVLVFFPKNADLSRIVARTSWHHAVDGTTLDRSEESYEARLVPIKNQWRGLGLTVEELKKIDELPLEGNYWAFADKMDHILSEHCKNKPDSDKYWKQDCEYSKPSKEDPEKKSVHVLLNSKNAGEKERTYAYVWAHLLSALPGSRFSTTVVDLPKQRPVCPPPRQLVTYVEDDNGVSVALRGGKDLPGQLKAAMHWSYLTPAAPAAPAAATAPRRTYAGAMVASAINIAEGRTAATLQFASDRMEPPAGMQATAMSPIAVELSDCGAGTANAIPENSGIERLLGPSSQIYMLSARIPKKADDAAKNKAPTASLSATSAKLLIRQGTAATTVAVDLGENPKTAFALTAVDATIHTALPAANITRRVDGAYQVKASGPVDLTFRNLEPNQTLDLELRPIDEKNKLGAAVKKLTFTARKS